MNEIERLAEISVLRASGFAGIAIFLVMLSTAFDFAASFSFGALGLAVLASSMALYARFYHVRKRIDETEVWNMLPRDERPDRAVARRLIIGAMRDQLVEKSSWWAGLSWTFLAAAAFLKIISKVV